MDDGKTEPAENNLDAVLNKENNSVAPMANATKIEELTQTPSMKSQAANPYYDQQVQPGQVVGYNIPTNQKVVIPIAKAPKIAGPSKKFVRSVIIFFVALAFLALLAGLLYLGIKITFS